MGVGRPEAECLTSYIARLAAAHCVSPGTLFARELYPLVRATLWPGVSKGLKPRPRHQPQAATTGIIDAAQAWNGADRSARSLVCVLEQLTQRQGLCALTLLPLEPVLSRQFLLRRCRAWCPRCYDEWSREGQVIYEPLLWTLNLVAVCPRHQRPLELVCPHCQRRLNLLATNARTGHCSRCQQWLGHADDARSLEWEPSEENDLDYQVWVAASLGELIAAAPGLAPLLSKAKFTQTIIDCVNRLAGGNAKALASFIGICANAIYIWQSGETIPRLDVLLRMCFRLNLSVIEFLTGQAFAGHDLEVQAIADQIQCATGVPVRDSHKIREGKVRQALTAALNEDPPPPLSEVARRLGYTRTSCLYKKFGSLSRTVAANYRASAGSRPASRPPRIRPSYQDKEDQMRQALEQELRRKHPRPPAEVATALGYPYPTTAYRTFPDLWQKIMAKRQRSKQERLKKRLAQDRLGLKAALKEDPPPTMRAVIKRLGYRSGDRLYQHFSKECHAIARRHAQYKQSQIDEVRAKLRSALKENPPRPLKEVARSLGYEHSTLYRRDAQLCRAIAARHTEYRKDCTRKRREVFKQQVREIAIRLHERGLHPSEERVRPLLTNAPMMNFVILNEVLREIRAELSLPSL